MVWRASGDQIDKLFGVQGIAGLELFKLVIILYSTLGTSIGYQIHYIVC